jgi:ABC-type transporter Mla subunit MlaD
MFSVLRRVKDVEDRLGAVEQELKAHRDEVDGKISDISQTIHDLKSVTDSLKHDMAKVASLIERTNGQIGDLAHSHSTQTKLLTELLSEIKHLGCKDCSGK